MHPSTIRVASKPQCSGCHVVTYGLTYEALKVLVRKSKNRQDIVTKHCAAKAKEPEAPQLQLKNSQTYPS